MTTPLLPILQDHIRAHGPMDIATYMQFCLSHPEHGYYTAKENVFGRPGDFITAPDISQLFGEMVGFWIADIWAQMGKPRPFSLVELGPGRGTWMRDILRITDRIPGMSNAMYISLVETSPARISEQAAALHGYDVTWFDDVDDLPVDDPIIIINNEFFDALPVRQIGRMGQNLFEVAVNLDHKGDLHRVKIPYLNDIPDMPDATIVEFSEMRDQVARALYARIRHQGGVILTIDYGYDIPLGRPTLQAVRNHTHVDFLDSPGHADLTALVDFGRLAALAHESGLSVRGPVGQGIFLKNLGIATRAEKILENAPLDMQENIRTGLSRLVDPDQMGVLFRVLCAYHPRGTPLYPAGFDPDVS